MPNIRQFDQKKLTDNFLRGKRCPRVGPDGKQIRITGDENVYVVIGRKTTTFYPAPLRNANGVMSRFGKLGTFPDMSVEEAQSKARAIREEWKSKSNARDARATRTTFREFYDELIDQKRHGVVNDDGVVIRRATSASNVRRWESCWQHLESLGSKHVRNVRSAEVSAIFGSLVQAEKFRTANLVKQLAKQILELGHNYQAAGELPQDDLRGVNARDGRIDSTAEWSRVMQVLREWDYRSERNLVICQALWGSRFEEAQRVRWSWIKDDIIHIPTDETKTKRKPLRLPIWGEIDELIKEQQIHSNHSEFVFPQATNPEKHVGHSGSLFQFVKRKTGESYGTSDFRHWWRQRATEIGIREEIIERMQGRNLPTAGRRYGKLSADVLISTSKEVVGALGGSSGG